MLSELWLGAGLELCKHFGELAGRQGVLEGRNCRDLLLDFIFSGFAVVW